MSDHVMVTDILRIVGDAEVLKSQGQLRQGRRSFKLRMQCFFETPLVRECLFKNHETPQFFRTDGQKGSEQLRSIFAKSWSNGNRSPNFQRSSFIQASSRSSLKVHSVEKLHAVF